ncbi:MAG TPA: HAD hydrolase-like protein [Candidatus Binatia bacterium]
MVNVLFDLDGTLTDPREGIVACLKYALLGLGHNCPSDLDLARFIGPPLQESFAVLLHTTDRKQINAAVELYRQRFSSKGMLENTVYPGIHSALITLRGRGALLFVTTSKPRVFAERIVEHFGLREYFVPFMAANSMAPAQTKATSSRMSFKPSRYHRTRRLWWAIARMISWAPKLMPCFPLVCCGVMGHMTNLSLQAQQRSASNRRHSIRCYYPILS